MGTNTFILKLIIFITLLCTTGLYSQVLIDSILIKDTKSQKFHHLTAERVSKDTLENNSIDFLNHIIGGQVQQNTPGGLTTFLHRGMGNRHLPVLWNGVNIQNALNGSFDLNLIPLFLFNHLSFFSSISPFMTGNNSFAGMLDLGKDQSSPNTTFMLSASSLQNYGLGAKTTFTKNNLLIKAGAQWNYDKNLFSYKFDNLKYERQPTSFNVINAITEVNFSWSANNYITSEVWWQKAEREIPVSITSAATGQHQADQNLRANIAHYLIGKKNKLKTSISYMQENLNFVTPVIDSRALSNVFIVRSSWEEKSSKQYQIALSFRKDIASPNFYSQKYVRNTFQWSGSKKIKWSENIISDLTFRQDLVSSQLMPLAFNLQTYSKIFSLNVSRNYTLPGFNDLYWPTGGNPALKTEKSLRGEIKSNITLLYWKLKISVYGNLIDNWIQWVPQNTGIWSAINQKKVLSRGFEFSAISSFYLNKVRISPEFSYAFNTTTAVGHYSDPIFIGKQLIYVPKHKSTLMIQCQIRKHHFFLSQTFTGIRYDTPDNTSDLPPIFLTNFGYTFHTTFWQFKFQVNNVLNQSYSNIRYFPMPGCNINIITIYNLNK